MFYKGNKRSGKLLERGFHGCGEKIRSEVLKRVDPAFEIILDVGTGSGRNLKFIAELFKDAKVFSIDPSLEALEIVYRMLREESLERKVTLVGCVGECLPFKDGSYDIAFSVMSLHHVSNIKDVLHEMARAIKTISRIIIVDWTPDASKLMNQPPSHFLPVDIFERTINELKLCCQIKVFSTWYISEVYNKFEQKNESVQKKSSL